MALLPILRFPDPRLHKVAAPIATIDDGIRRLAQDMAETMYEAPGIGLAATQVDVHQQLIVIDTLSASLAGELSENSNDDMAQVLLKLYRLQRQTGASILLVHHSGHDGSNERGASALRCNVDTSIRISTSGAHRKWTVIKQKDGSDGISDLFDLAQVEVTRNDGQIVNSIVVRHLKTSSETKVNVVTQLTKQQQSISGVNLDEEYGNLQRYQQYYLANAQVLQTANALFDALINIR